jgi:DNA-binding CsgD family transcriptional regulator
MIPGSLTTVEIDTARCSIVLSDREIEILCAVAEGKSSTEIAEELNITPRTVEFHLTSINEKLKTRSRTHAVAEAMRKGIINGNCDE